MRKLLTLVSIAVIVQSSQVLAASADSDSSSSTPETATVSSEKSANTAPSLINGIYLVLRQGNDSKSIEPAGENEHLLVYDERALEGDDKADVTYFIVQKEPFIPMTLANDPDKGTDTKGKSMLLLQLADNQVKRLEDFTRENVNKGVAIVIGGTVVSSHKIREPIVGGKLQITRCTDNRCETIYTELLKERKKASN